MPVGHGRMRDGAEHASAQLLHDSAALVGVSVCRHDRIAHQLLGERAGQPVLLRQMLNLQPDSTLLQDKPKSPWPVAVCLQRVCPPIRSGATRVTLAASDTGLSHESASGTPLIDPAGGAHRLLGKGSSERDSMCTISRSAALICVPGCLCAGLLGGCWAACCPPVSQAGAAFQMLWRRLGTPGRPPCRCCG